MFHTQSISSLDLPALAPYRTLRRAAEHASQGIFVAEGDKVVRRLLTSRFGVVSVLLPENRVAEFEPLLRARPEKEIPVFAVTRKSVLEALVGFEMFQGVLAIGRIPAAVTLETVLAGSADPKFFAAVDGLTSAENIGLLVRNGAAFGLQALIVGETSSSPFLRRAVRNSMGTIFQLPVVELKSGTGETRRFFCRTLCAGCGRTGCAAWRRIRTPIKKSCRRRISPAIAASCLAAKARGCRRRSWPPATRRWRFPWRRAWTR